MLRMEGAKKHVVMLTSVGMGHCSPFLALAMKLLTKSIDSVAEITFITTTLFPPHAMHVAKNLQSQGLPLNLTSLPHPCSDDGNPVKFIPCVDPLSALSYFMEKSVPAFEVELKSIADREGAKNVVFLTDAFCSEMIEPAQKLGIKTYILSAFCAMAFYMLLYHSLMDSEGTARLHERDPNDMVDVPHLGTVPVWAFLPESRESPDSDTYKLFVKYANTLAKADGALINSFDLLEPPAFTALRTATSFAVPPVVPVGPLIFLDRETDHQCLKWLDMQPSGSVIYVSFGSAFGPSADLVAELAAGLESSGQRFLWVAAVSLDMPPGFEERVSLRSMVVKGWAPQVAILAHGSVGGYLCQSGVNSVMESIWHGVPMLVCPFFGDQFTCAYSVCVHSKIALLLEKRPDGVVPRDEVARKVVELMEGEIGKETKAATLRVRENARKASEESASTLRNLFRD